MPTVIRGESSAGPRPGTRPAGLGEAGGSLPRSASRARSRRALEWITGVDWTRATRGERGAALGTALLLVGLCVRGWRRAVAPHGSDFSIYLEAGRAVLEGSDPYSVHGFLYPPFFAVAMAPLAALGLGLAAGLWELASLGALLFVMRTSLRPITAGAEPTNLRAPWLWFLPALVATRLIDSNFAYGQANLIVLGLVVASLQAWRHERPTLAGLLAGLATALKVLPAVLFVYWLLRRSPRSAWVGLVTTALLVLVLPAGPLGWSGAWESLGSWIGGDAGALVLGGSALLEARDFPAGQSLAAGLYRLLCDVPATSDGASGLRVNLASLPPDRVRWIVLAAQAAVVGLTARALAGRPRGAPGAPGDLSDLGDRGPTGAVESAVVLCAALLVGPLVHKAHLIWMLPGLTAVAALATRRRERALALLAAAAIALPTSALVGSHLARTWQAHGGLTLGLLALWTALLSIRRRREPANRGARERSWR